MVLLLYCNVFIFIYIFCFHIVSLVVLHKLFGTWPNDSHVVASCLDIPGMFSPQSRC